MNTLQWISDTWVLHTPVILTAALVVVGQAAIVVWLGRRLRELAHMRERMSRLADGLVLLTDTTEAGLATIIRQLEQPAKRRAVTKASTRKTVSTRVVAALNDGEDMARIVERESLSESEVRLHAALAESQSRRRDQATP